MLTWSGICLLTLGRNFTNRHTHRRRSSVNFRGHDIFTGKNVWKIIKMPEFYMILARKINKIPEFYIIIAQKIFQIFFLGGGGVPPTPSPSPPPFPTPHEETLWLLFWTLLPVSCFEIKLRCLFVNIFRFKYYTFSVRKKPIDVGGQSTLREVIFARKLCMKN